MTKSGEFQKHDVIVLLESTTIQHIEDESKNLPSDVHIVRYTEDGVEKIDAVRAYRKTDIFDAYHDFGLRDIKEITSGFGSIRPNLYNPNPDKKKDKK